MCYFLYFIVMLFYIILIICFFPHQDAKGTPSAQLVFCSVFPMFYLYASFILTHSNVQIDWQELFLTLSSKDMVWLKSHKHANTRQVQHYSRSSQIKGLLSCCSMTKHQHFWRRCLYARLQSNFLLVVIFQCWYSMLSIAERLCGFT